MHSDDECDWLNVRQLAALVKSQDIGPRQSETRAASCARENGAGRSDRNAAVVGKYDGTGE